MKIMKSFFNSREAFAFIFIIILFVSVGAVNPAFLSINNLSLSLNGSVVYTMISVGIAFVILTGEIDVSIGATLGLTSAVAATLLRDGSSLPVAIIFAMLIGIFIGIINGVGVVLLKIPSIIMTLGTNSIIRGFIYVYTKGKWIENLPYEFKALSQISVVGKVSLFYILVIALTIIIYFYLNNTKSGKNFSAVGDNQEGALLVGLPVIRTRILVFIISGVFAALGGILYISRVGFVTPMAGNGYEMTAIAACVLGGISLKGGVGSVIGAALGALIMSSISRVLVFLQFSSDYNDTITGILLIVIVVVDALIQKRSREKARRKRLSAKTVIETINVADNKGGVENA